MTSWNTEEKGQRHFQNAGTRKSNAHPHNMKAAEIRELLISIGWVGEARARVVVMRLPVFDKGPGVQL